MAFGILRFSCNCGGAIQNHALRGKDINEFGATLSKGFLVADMVAVIVMGVILGVAAGGALHLSPAAAYGMTGAIAAIFPLDIGGHIFYHAVGKKFECLK